MANPDDEDMVEMLQDPPEFLFEVLVDDEPRGRIFGPQEKRNWVLWKLSQYVLALESEGVVTVRRYISAKWEPADNWRALGM